MKLASKVSLFNIGSSLFVSIIASVVLFIFFDRLAKEEVYNELQRDVKTTIKYIEAGVAIAALKKNKDINIYIIKANEVIHRRPFRDKVESKQIENQTNSREYSETQFPKKTLEKARITFDKKVNGQWYRIVYTKNKMTPLSLFITSFVGVLILLGIIILITVVGNLWLFKRLFTPFYKVLNQLKVFDVTKSDVVNFMPSGIKEFSFLNEKLEFFMEKSQKEYTQLKEFSENASHELQTPIAIIKSKLNLLQQSENLSEKDLIKIEEIQQTLQKTSHLNRTLLLLNKIENREFNDIEEIQIKTAVESVLRAFSEIIELKQLKIEIDLKNFKLQINSFLLDLLLKNLIHNAIKHNYFQGSILIVIRPKYLIITNSGNPLEFSAEHYFQRFKKGNQKLQSTGLGLAIVKQICLAGGFEVSYGNTETKHKIQITF